MISELTQKLISDRGWTYVPEHDIVTGKYLMVTSTFPECWMHDTTDKIAWTIDEVLELINDEIELEIERDLD